LETKEKGRGRKKGGGLATPSFFVKNLPMRLLASCMGEHYTEMGTNISLKFQVLNKVSEIFER
jgi:hypothetical protein